jgi:quinol-cytochrome oxidoreductase complex cytochrome b subunit
VVLIWRSRATFGFKFAATWWRGSHFFMKGPDKVVLDPKVWGVVLMGCATLIFFLLPWLDQSPVKSIRYKGPLTRPRSPSS